jgi:hypothetical protein
MRDTINYNEKIKTVYDEFNEAPKNVTHPDSSPMGNTDNASFVSESNHTTSNQLTSQDTSEFNTVAKPL